MIIGDKESLKEESRTVFEGMGAKVVVREDENTTDCEQALVYLEKNVLPEAMKAKAKAVKIVIMGAFGGRLDHTLQNLNLLWKKSLKHPIPVKDYEIMMFDNQNVVTVLKPGHNTIKLSTKVEGRKGCGLVPFTLCHQISTTGLKYNMGPTYAFKTLEFGEFLSTSNEAISDTIVVDTSDPLMWMSTTHSL